MTDHIAEWKYWSDEILDQVQSYYEFNCGYNGECDHVWVAVKDDKYKLPAIENKFKYVLVVAATCNKREQEKRRYENKTN